MADLFIPLNREYYERFKAGTKQFEIRKYGPRWNEKTCYPVRAAVVSLGYGKASRMHATVKQMVRMDRDDLPEPHRSDAIKVYGDHRDLAVIYLEFPEE